MHDKGKAPPSLADTRAIADRLHSVAIQLLRRLRRVDVESTLSGPRLSALSVLVFGGPITLSELAAAEQVRPPTMTRLVQALEGEGYLRRIPDPEDRRVTRVAATPKGIRVMREGRDRRVKMLSDLLRALPRTEVSSLQAAVSSLERALARRNGGGR